MNKKKKPQYVEFKTLPENEGPFDTSRYQPGEIEATARALGKSLSYRADPFAAARATMLMRRGVFRPSDIRQIISV